MLPFSGFRIPPGKSTKLWCLEYRCVNRRVRFLYPVNCAVLVAVPFCSWRNVPDAKNSNKDEHRHIYDLNGLESVRTVPLLGALRPTWNFLIAPKVTEMILVSCRHCSTHSQTTSQPMFASTWPTCTYRMYRSLFGSMSEFVFPKNVLKLASEQRLVIRVPSHLMVAMLVEIQVHAIWKHGVLVLSAHAVRSGVLQWRYIKSGERPGYRRVNLGQCPRNVPQLHSINSTHLDLWQNGDLHWTKKSSVSCHAAIHCHVHVLVIQVEAAEPSLGHLQEPIREGHGTHLLLAVAVRAPSKWAGTAGQQKDRRAHETRVVTDLCCSLTFTIFVQHLSSISTTTGIFDQKAPETLQAEGSSPTTFLHEPHGFPSDSCSTMDFYPVNLILQLLEIIVGHFFLLAHIHPRTRQYRNGKDEDWRRVAIYATWSIHPFKHYDIRSIIRACYEVSSGCVD